MLSPTHVKKALGLLAAGGRLINGYGPTENTTFTTCYRVPATYDGKHSACPIGRPISNTQCYVLDEQLQPVPAGVPGELFAGGDGLALGYLNQPELSAGKFIPHPFQPGARLYRTGDRVRYLADGNLEFLGRLDSQVKIHGFRVEPGEIEAVLGRNPLVRECTVVVQEDPTVGKRLVAYIVAREGMEAAAQDLREFLKGKLPEYMVPSVFVQLVALPLTPNGKVDRRGLPTPDRTRSGLKTQSAPPRDPTEADLAAIWETVLGVESIGVRESFFELGGDSFLAVRLFSQIEKHFGKKLPLTLLFRSPTIEQLAGALRESAAPLTPSLLLPIQSAGFKPPLFLVHGAGGGMLWGYANLARHLDPQQPVYGIESRGMKGLEEFSRIEDMAAEYIREIRAFQPAGPYFLGGYCFGGNVAYEMARQIHALGERVALLALFESAPTNGSYYHYQCWRPGFIRDFIRNSFYRALDLFHMKPEARRNFIQRKINALKKKILGKFHPAKARPPIDLEGFIDISVLSKEEIILWQCHLRSAGQYIEQPYSGCVTLFRTRRQPFLCSFDSAYSWGELAGGGVAVKMVPGSHDSVFLEPNVGPLAEQLKAALAETQAVMVSS